jgi:hypothetical protein
MYAILQRSTGRALMANRWFALIAGQRNDLSFLKRYFSSSKFEFKELDELFALSAPAFESCGDRDCAANVASTLLANLNVAVF